MKKIEVLLFDENKTLSLNVSLTTRKDIKIENVEDRHAKVRALVARDTQGKNAAVTWRHDGIPEGFLVLK